MKNYNFFYFFELKSINFSHILHDNKKIQHGDPTIFFVLLIEKICLILQNTINLEKWQDFNLKNFNYLV